MIAEVLAQSDVWVPVCSFCGRALVDPRDRVDKGCCRKCWSEEHQ